MGPGSPACGIADYFKENIFKVGFCRGHIGYSDSGIIDGGYNLSRINAMRVETDHQPAATLANLCATPRTGLRAGLWYCNLSAKCKQCAGKRV